MGGTVTVLSEVVANPRVLPKPPLYFLHIAQLVLGVTCIYAFRAKQPLSDRSGRIYPNQSFIRAAFLIVGVVALVFGISVFALDCFWHFTQ